MATRSVFFSPLSAAVVSAAASPSALASPAAVVASAFVSAVVAVVPPPPHAVKEPAARTPARTRPKTFFALIFIIISPLKNIPGFTV